MGTSLFSIPAKTLGNTLKRWGLDYVRGCQNSQHSKVQDFETWLQSHFFPSSFLSAGTFQECWGRALWQRITEPHTPLPVSQKGFSPCSRRLEEPTVCSSAPGTKWPPQQETGLQLIQWTLSWRCCDKTLSGSWKQEFIERWFNQETSPVNPS